MKTPRWLLNLAIVLINLLRPLISFYIFCELFYFRILNVACLYMLYVIADSTEGIIVFLNRGIWSKGKKIFYHINNTIFTFVVTGGVLLHAPLFLFLSWMGINIQALHTLKVWLLFFVIVFVLVLLIAYDARMAWGGFTYLLARLSFLLYCFYHMWPDRGILIPFFLAGAWFLIAIEGKKYNWDWNELRKKDLRFRRKKIPPLI